MTKCTYKKEEFTVAKADLIAKLNELSATYKRDLADGKVIFEVPDQKAGGGERRERGEKKEKAEKKEKEPKEKGEKREKAEKGEPKKKEGTEIVEGKPEEIKENKE